MSIIVPVDFYVFSTYELNNVFNIRSLQIIWATTSSEIIAKSCNLVSENNEIYFQIKDNVNEIYRNGTTDACTLATDKNCKPYQFNHKRILKPNDHC